MTRAIILPCGFFGSSYDAVSDLPGAYVTLLETYKTLLEAYS